MGVISLVVAGNGKTSKEFVAEDRGVTQAKGRVRTKVEPSARNFGDDEALAKAGLRQRWSAGEGEHLVAKRR